MLNVQQVRLRFAFAKSLYLRRLFSKALAEELNLIVTAGSNFHGTNRKDVYLGRIAAHLPIEDRFFTDNLLPALAAVNADYRQCLS